MYFSSVDLFLVLLVNFSLGNLIKNNTMREKFVFFLLIIVFASFCGFYYSFDGFIMFLLATELMVLLLLLFLSLSYNFLVKTSFIQWTPFSILVLGSVSIYFFALSISANTFSFSHTFIYQSLPDIHSSDLYLLFQIFFVEYPSFIIFITLLLSLFTVFFVLFYFKLKKLHQKEISKSKSIKLLRFQAATKQSLFKAKLRYFFNKK